MSKGTDERKKTDEKLQFEASMAKLESVVKKLESGEGTLAEMIALYEEGMDLVGQCGKRLDAYEAKITKLAELEDAVHDDA